jgi:hypothetical protein
MNTMYYYMYCNFEQSLYEGMDMMDGNMLVHKLNIKFSNIDQYLEVIPGWT